MYLFFGDDRAFKKRSRSVQGAFTFFERALVVQYNIFERAFNKRSRSVQVLNARSKSVQEAFSSVQRAFSSVQRAFNERSARVQRAFKTSPIFNIGELINANYVKSTVLPWGPGKSEFDHMKSSAAGPGRARRTPAARPPEPAAPRLGK